MKLTRISKIRVYVVDRERYNTTSLILVAQISIRFDSDVLGTTAFSVWLFFKFPS